jgi:hypothetical protein
MIFVSPSGRGGLADVHPHSVTMIRLFGRTTADGLPPVKSRFATQAGHRSLRLFHPVTLVTRPPAAMATM